MLKDITMGQYFPGNSVIHRLDPRTKIILTFSYMIMLFLTTNIFCYAFSACLALGAYIVSGIQLKFIIKSLKPILPLILFTVIMNLLFVNGTALWSLWFISISYEGVTISISMTVRLICLIAGTSLLTYTSSPIALTDAIESFLNPLKKIKFPSHEISMMMTIALRFIPALIEETQKITSAQKARGADMETGGLIKRTKAIIPILIPLFVSAFRRAEELATAMECRCYNGGVGRTRLKQLQYKRGDFIAMLVIAVAISCVIIIATFLPMGTL